jgi:hypothetical protein
VAVVFLRSTESPHMPGFEVDLIEQGLTATGDDDLISTLMKCLGKSAADAASAAGYQDGITCEIHVFDSPEKTKRSMPCDEGADDPKELLWFFKFNQLAGVLEDNQFSARHAAGNLL